MKFSKNLCSIAAGALIAVGGALPAGAEDQAPPSEDQAPPSLTLADPSLSPASLALATQIVDLGYPEESREELFFATMDQTVAQMRSAIAPSLPNDDPGAIAILDTWIAEYLAESKDVLRKHIPSIMSGMTQAYATIFTEEELTDILAFVRTPSGQRFFELSPAVLGEPSFAEANQRYLDESMGMLPEAQAELMSRLQEHMAKQAQDTAMTQS